MELYEYKLKSTDEQWNELWNKGTHIDNRIYLDSKFSLYALHMFFVEVELSKTDKIIAKIEFNTGELLDKYSGNLT
jgi:hypothetical protein